MDTVHLGCLSKEGQDDLHPPDRRNLPSILLRALRAPKHYSSNQGDMAGNPPERGNERDKEREIKSKNLLLQSQLWFHSIISFETRLRVWLDCLMSMSWMSFPPYTHLVCTATDDWAVSCSNTMTSTHAATETSVKMAIITLNKTQTRITELCVYHWPCTVTDLLMLPLHRVWAAWGDVFIYSRL